tara:strand:- start:180 stop:533 length:354 start_codon:yes stop_codon:yes gene_type:complete
LISIDVDARSIPLHEGYHSDCVTSERLEAPRRALVSQSFPPPSFYAFHLRVSHRLLFYPKIQTGQLTPEAYMEMVNKKIAEEKEFAKAFMGGGMKEEAKLALLRAKLMEKELTEEEE